MKKAAKVLALGLAVSMVLPMASCKKKEKNNIPLNPDGTPRAQYVEAADPYYSDTTVSFTIPVDESRKLEGYGVHGGQIVGDKIYISYRAQYVMTDAEREELDNINPWAPEELKRSFEIRQGLEESGIVVYTMDGTKESAFRVDNNEYIGSFFVTKDGKIGACISSTEYVVEEGSGELNEEHESRLVYFSEDGQRLSEIVCDAENPYLFDSAKVVEAENGNLLVMGYGGLTVLDPSGKILGAEAIEGDDPDFYREGGKYYAVSSEWKDISGAYMCMYSLQEIDVNTGKLGEAQTSKIMPQELRGFGEEHFDTGNREGIEKCDLLAGTMESLVKYNETDITPFLFVRDIRTVENGDLLILHEELTGDGAYAQTIPYLTRLHKEEKNPYAGKRIVYAATCTDGAEDTFVKIIKEYNKRPESKAYVVTYAQPADVDGFEQAKSDSADKLLLAMKSGNGPDVLLNCAEFSQFNTDKVLVDLNPYLDGESGIDRSKYYDNILRACEYGGKLYQMPLSVTLSGLVGNPDLLGRPEGWTLAELDAKLGALPDGVYPTLLSPEEILKALLFVDMDHYVDYSGGKANFDSDDFRALLEFSKKYGGLVGEEKLMSLYEEFDEITYDGGPANLMMQAGVCALTTMDVSNLRWYSVYSILCGNAPLMIGWPSSAESGLSANVRTSVGISAFSDCQDEAFDFVSFLLASEDRFSFWGGISVLRAGTDSLIESEIAEYNELASIYEDDMGMIADRFELTEELADEYRALIGRIHSCIHTNPTVMNIVLEEAPAFFNGSKSAADVSVSIQNRVTTLLQEQQ